ncbi:hypothetical protein KEJ27_00015 [Candidatus Bathyarchaeota archaeon]|nr:hypothetical protein [Candidatus Bathyarchaeota archaeon]MBS7618684.1 hypothetical protein [Candidatus Bathyarchaeota archaeon]
MVLPKQSKDKRLVWVRADILSQINRIANREGKTITTFVNEVLEQSVRVYDMKLTLTEVVDLYMLTKMCREGGNLTMPRNAVRYLISKVYHSNREELMQVFHDAGAWFGKYMMARMGGENLVERLRQILYVSVWDANEVYVDKNGDVISIRCVAPQLSMEETELLASYVYGMLYSIGFKSIEREVIRGIIIFKVKGGGVGEQAYST